MANIAAGFGEPSGCLEHLVLVALASVLTQTQILHSFLLQAACSMLLDGLAAWLLSFAEHGLGCS